MRSRRFSIKQGVYKARNVVLLRGLDDRLWSRLWSAMHRVFWSHFDHWIKDSELTRVVIWKIQDEFLGKPIDELDPRSDRFIADLKSIVTVENWAEFYDLVQFLADFSEISGFNSIESDLRMMGEIFSKLADEILEEERSGYRFVAGELVNITEEVEIESLEEALSGKQPFEGAKVHLRTAIQHFGNRENPDFRNSIKESISAVESFFFEFNHEKSSSLTSALRKAQKAGFGIHPALAAGLEKIYGWTSDEDGVRHAMLDATSVVNEAEARFMLLFAASLINYLSILSNRPTS